MNTPFQLEQAISCWRAELNASGTIGNNDLAELETHLRESHEELRTHALADDEAFLIARRRLGGAEVVEELAKVDTGALWAGRAWWMILGVLLSQIFWTCSRIVTVLAQTGIALSTQGFGWSGTAVTVGQVFVALLTIVLFAFLLVRLVRGKWRLENPKRFAFLVHPAFLVFLVSLQVALQALPILSTRFLGLVAYGNLTQVQQYVQMPMAILTPVILAMALTMAQRRARQMV